MDLKREIPRFSIFFLLVLLLLCSVIMCSTPSWFPIKKGPPHKAKMKELLDKEVIIIDNQEYVKVNNPRVSESMDQPRYLYIPVDEYLSRGEVFTTPSIHAVEGKKEEFAVPTKPSSPTIDSANFPKSKLPPIAMVSDLKKKIMVIPFDDRTMNSDEVLGDWVAEKLINEASRRSQRILFVDYPMVKEFLEKRGIALTDLESSKVLSLLNEVFGLQAVVIGELSGPYTFITQAEKDRDSTASAIIKIDMRLVDTLTGKTVKSLSAKNPIIATKEKGAFSEERAKLKAINLTLADLSSSLSREIDGLDWSCRVAKVEGDEVYINAGRLTGLQVGDVMEVFRPGEPGGRGEVKGRIQIAACFGIDASIGRMVNGKKPDVNDILKLAKQEGA